MNNFQEWAYIKSPASIQNLLASTYGQNLARKKYSPRFKETLNILEKSERLNKVKLAAFQLKQIRQIIQYAYDNVPYYHSLFNAEGVRPSEIKTIDDLKKIPILSKEDVRHNSKELISKEFSRWSYDIHHTSGTTGTALNVVWSQEATMKEYAFVERIRRRAGKIDSRETHITFGGRLIASLAQREPPFWRVNRAENQYLFSMHHLNEKNLPYYIEKIRELKPSYIEGYPSLVYVVAEYVVQNEQCPIPAKAVFTSSETLLSFQRQVIEAAFQCKVFDRYGSTELAASIGECEQGGFHIDAEYGIIEFLRDGEEVSDGEVGEMVCTNFVNPAFPLIRYNVGDLAKPSSDLCPCGRGLPLIREIIGRIDDTLVTEDGVFLGRLDHIFKETANIKESQILQMSPDEIVVKVVRRNGYRDKDTVRLLHEFRKRLGENMKIRIRFAESIPRQPNGKFKAVISTLDNHSHDK
jgi:phenylacetate-CoA ligase